MTTTKKIAISITGCGVIGLACAHFLVLPQAQECIEIAEKISGIFQILGGVFAISGSLLGWSVTNISQTRTVLKDYSDNRRAEDIFHELSGLQITLIWCWAIVFSASIVAVLYSAAMFDYWIYFSSIALITALGHTIFLLMNMIKLSLLKIEVDNFDFENLRKSRKMPNHEIFDVS